MPIKGSRKIVSASLRAVQNSNSTSDLILGREAQLLTNSRELSIIGFRQCLDSSRSCWNRVLWGVLVACGFMLSVYQINDRFVYYVKYPTSSEVDVIGVKTLEFPQVTICSENFIKKSAAAEAGLIEYFKGFMPPFRFSDGTLEGGPLNYSQDELSKLRQFLSPGKEQLYMCFWQRRECPVNIGELIFTNHGHCLTFNPSKFGLVATNVGTTSGLSLIMFANHSDYFIQYGGSVGYALLLHEPEEPPRMRELGVKIGVGQSVSVAISENSIHRLKYPYGICRDEKDYHPVKCRMECERKAVFTKCGCRAVYMPGEEDICDFFTEIDCVDRLLQDFYSRPDNVDLCFCAPLCDEINYRATISASGFSRNFIEAMTTFTNMSAFDFSENFVHIEIFMSEMQVSKISTVASYSFMALLSDVGGALGLLLGSTILTYFEILDLIWQLILYKIATKNEKPNNTVVHFY